MTKHETVQQTDQEHFSNDWRDKVTKANKYEKHRLEFLNLLEKLADMWDERLGRITTANIELN